MSRQSDRPQDVRRRSNWLQFSLKSLILLTLLASAYCAGWTNGHRRVTEAQEQAKRQAELAANAEAQARKAAEMARVQAALIQAQANTATVQAQQRAAMIEREESSSRTESK